MTRDPCSIITSNEVLKQEPLIVQRRRAVYVDNGVSEMIVLDRAFRERQLQATRYTVWPFGRPYKMTFFEHHRAAGMKRQNELMNTTLRGIARCQCLEQRIIDCNRSVCR